MPVPVPSKRPPISFPFAVPRDLFQLKGQEAALEQSRPCGHRGEEGGKAVASALARLMELKELQLILLENKIGQGPRRALCSDPGRSRSARAAVAWTADHCALSPHLSVARGGAGAAAVAESLRNLRQLTKVTVWLGENALGPGLEVC